MIFAMKYKKLVFAHLDKLKNNGINGNLLSLIEFFLNNRYQRVPLNRHYSKSKILPLAYHQNLPQDN